MQAGANAAAATQGGRFRIAARARHPLERKSQLASVGIRNPRAAGSEARRLHSSWHMKHAEDEVQKREYGCVVLVECLFFGGMVPAMEQRTRDDVAQRTERP